MEEFRGQTTLVVDRGAIRAVCQLLHDEPRLSYDLLAALTAVDFWPEEPRFSIVYQLHSLKHKVFLGLRVPRFSSSPDVASNESVYPNANLHEREVFDMFGVTFGGPRTCAESSCRRTGWATRCARTIRSATKSRSLLLTSKILMCASRTRRNSYDSTARSNG